MFCIPGLFHYPNRPTNIETGEVVGSFTVITRAANEVMAQIHNCGDNAFRMPLFLTKELEMRWLEPDLSDDDISSVLNYEMPSGELEFDTVFTIRTTKPRPDNGSKIDPFEWPNLPPLGEESEMQKTLF